MKKIYLASLLLLFFFSISFSLFAQNNFFTPTPESAIQLTNNSKRVIIPAKFNTLKADINQLRSFLWSLPSEKNVGNRNLAPVLELPMPDGKMAKFHVWESSIMAPGLETKFPEMKTFAGQGITDPYATIRFDYSPYWGFSAQILSAVSGRIFIEPYARGEINNYMSYYSRDFTRTVPFNCEVPDNPIPPSIIAAGPCRGTQLYTYRLALACTGEYAVAVCSPQSPTVPLTAAAMLIAVNRVTGVYETETSIRMVLVPNNDLLIYLDGATDPYTNNNGGTMLNQNINNCNAVIGANNYDIGHVFSTGGGGVAFLGCICTGSKAGGVTGLPNPTGDAFYIDYVAHEMGHQYGGNHTFNSTTSACGGGNRNASTAYEVGSATSIQGYAGICGADDIQPHSDPFFHTISFDEISNYAAGTGGTCAAITSTGNALPVITSMNNNGVNIPIGTPFTLSGTATDANNDALTFCWEEWDLGTAGAWNNGANSTTAPLFKSRIPKTVGERTFPDIAVILAGYPANPPSAMGGLKGETLPQVARAIKFRLTVRDNRAGGGGVVTGGDGCQAGFTGIFQVNTIATGGPFAVTAPNGGENYNGGSTQTITWNVVGTNNAPISVANVKISLSTDGGLTYPTVLAASTANDGTEALTIPNITTTTARVKVEAIGNIFFDISNANFNITTVTVPTFTFVTPAPATVACGTATSMITLATTSVNGFVTPINLVATGNPGTTTVSYSVNPVIPGGSTDVTLNNVNTLAPGTYNVTITGTAGAEVKTVILSYIVSPGAGPAITAQPAPQTICETLNTSFSITSATATAFQWQLSTTGAGGPFTTINNGGVYSGATTATLTLTGVTAAMNTYQYRCVASVLCGSTNSNPALLTVQTAPAITSQPANSTVCGGSSSSFSITATGTGLTYQWQVSVTGCGGAWVNLANAAPYSGVTTATLTINPVTPAMNGYGYRCVVSGTCSPAATSGCGLLTANTPIAITTQPANSTVCATAIASFTVAVTGTAPTYQWQESTNGGANWTNITNAGIYSGATTITLTLTGVTAGMNNNQYRVVVNGAVPCTLVNSTGAVLTVNTAPAITTQPAVTTILCAGGNTTYTVAANGTALTYQWQITTTGPGGPWTNIANGAPYSGATTASLTITAAIANMNNYQYRCVVSGTCSPAATSNAAVLTVNTPISITTEPAATTNICATGSVSFTTVVTGTSPTYQWQLSTTGAAGPWNNIANGGVYSGATTATLTLTAVTAAMNTYRYRCVITGAAPCGSVTTNSANGVLNVTPQPVLSANSLTTLLAGQKTTLRVNVTPGPGLSFAWFKNGVLVPGATTDSLVVSVDNLGSYMVIITSGIVSCQSQPITITANPSSKLFVFPSPNNGIFKVSYYTSAPYPTKQSITIYDRHGSRVWNQEYTVNQEYQLHQIDMRSKGAGIYYIVLREANGNKIKTGEVLVR